MVSILFFMIILPRNKTNVRPILISPAEFEKFNELKVSKAEVAEIKNSSYQKLGIPGKGQ